MNDRERAGRCSTNPATEKTSSVVTRVRGVPAASAALGLAIAFAGAWGCTGYLGDAPSTDGGGQSSGTTTPGGGGPDSPTSFTCDPNQKPAMDQLRALSNRQYMNTLNDLLTEAIGATAAADVLSSSGVVSALALLPANAPLVPQPLPDPTPQIPGTGDAIANAHTLASAFPDGTWFRADQTIQSTRVTAFFQIAVALGQEISSTYLGQIAGNCALGTSGATDMGCLDAFVKSFGARALRRAVTQDDVTYYEGNYNLNGPDGTLTNPAASGYQDVLTGFFTAPEFIYFLEHGDPNASANASGVYPLSAYELASRLSYQVWDTIPDAVLWGHAVDGTIVQPTVFKQEVDRLFQDPRAQQTLDLFFGDYFQSNSQGGAVSNTGGLNYHNLGALGVNPDAVVKAFAGSDLPGPGLQKNMLADALGFADYYSWKSPGSITDFLTSNLSLAQTEDVANLYKLAPWDGKAAPPSFPPNQRPGLFTRALFVSSGVETTPILKGVYFRRYVLCDELGPPPQAAVGKVVQITGLETTAQATTVLTGTGVCASCHPLYINPLGFVTETFDGLGRYRSKEILYNADGTVEASLPLDTNVVPRVMESDGTTTASDAADLMNLAAASKKPAACLTRNYFRYTFARFEDVKADGCSLEQMRKTLDNGGHLLDLWKSVVSTPAFQSRTFE